VAVYALVVVCPIQIGKEDSILEAMDIRMFSLIELTDDTKLSIGL